ncbi:hypothetical protein CPB83DRAFT_842642 [Crepidotus variabilis]|uniref:Secreted protein n=1 Tax=Crepidotus variabilis TaxID=179855 RepID=A0A9P6JW30_9AGAR|nr:hypothetical protein CPB83DRAFT_842642 [Crepidotus variabilis]
MRASSAAFQFLRRLCDCFVIAGLWGPLQTRSSSCALLLLLTALGVVPNQSHQELDNNIYRFAAWISMLMSVRKSPEKFAYHRRRSAVRVATRLFYAGETLDHRLHMPVGLNMGC